MIRTIRSYIIMGLCGLSFGALAYNLFLVLWHFFSNGSFLGIDYVEAPVQRYLIVSAICVYGGGALLSVKIFSDHLVKVVEKGILEMRTNG